MNENETPDLWSDDEWRAQMSSAEINDLPDSDFAYIEPGGEKDDEGKTVPRSKRHFPINDANHVRNALARAPQSPFGDKAMPKILAAAKKFGIEVDGDRQAGEVLEKRRLLAERLDGAMENRRFGVSGFELRDTTDGGLRFTGYASTTEHAYEVGDFTETVARGAFKRTLSEGPDVVLLINHEGMPLARTKSGTMSLAEDIRGLRVDAELDPSDPDVQALLPKMRRGDIDQMSFAFRVTDQEWNQDYTQRLIRSVTIHRGDVSIVTMGANPATTSTVVARSDDGLLEVRAGKAISDANRATIQNALDLVAEADRAVDKAQPLLAGVLGIDNPDEPETPKRAVVVPDHTSIARAEYDLMVARRAA